MLGVLLGRFICGFLCPFGWLQELLHKIPTKKFSTKKLKPLTYLKYAVSVYYTHLDVYKRQILLTTPMTR